MTVRWPGVMVMVRPMQVVKIYGVQDRRSTAQVKLSRVVRRRHVGSGRLGPYSLSGQCQFAFADDEVVGEGIPQGLLGDE